MNAAQSTTSSEDFLLISSLKHNIRNDLASALIAADVLSTHSDQTVREHAKIILDALEKMRKRIQKDR